MLGSWVGVAVLAMLHEGLKVLREYIEMTSERDVDDVNRCLTYNSVGYTPSVDGAIKTVTPPDHTHARKRCVGHTCPPSVTIEVCFVLKKTASVMHELQFISQPTKTSRRTRWSSKVSK